MTATLRQPLKRTADLSEAEFNRRLELVAGTVDLYHRHLRVYLFRLTGNWHDAEDILQNLYHVVLLRFREEQIQQIGALRRKAYQLFVDFYRSRKRRPEVSADQLPDVPEPEAREQSFSWEEEARLKERFWADYQDIGLTALQKDAIWGHARYGLTYAELSEQLNVPVSTIGDWIKLARKKLADYLNTQT